MVHSWLHINRTETPTQSKWHPAESQSRTRQHRSTHQHQRREIKNKKQKENKTKIWNKRNKKKKWSYVCTRIQRRKTASDRGDETAWSSAAERTPPQIILTRWGTRRQNSGCFFSLPTSQDLPKESKKDDNFPRPKLERPSTPRLHVQLSVTARTHTHKNAHWGMSNASMHADLYCIMSLYILRMHYSALFFWIIPVSHIYITHSLTPPTIEIRWSCDCGN